MATLKQGKSSQLCVETRRSCHVSHCIPGRSAELCVIVGLEIEIGFLRIILDKHALGRNGIERSKPKRGSIVCATSPKALQDNHTIDMAYLGVTNLKSVKLA
jgi:hypothetical protein